jgi:hypothetical protein
MSTSAALPISVSGPSPQSAQAALPYLRRAIEKMKSLQTTERVLASVERVMLDRVPEPFDLKPLVAALNTLNTAIRAGDAVNLQAACGTVSQELETAFQRLAVRDERIMPYHLRRFCEGDGALLDLNALAALTSFYRALPHTEANRGKYDFAVTRLFTSPEPGRSSRYRHLRISREQLAKRLTEMCLAWGETMPSDQTETDRITDLIQQFDQFIAEVKQIHKFEELVNKAFFPRVRDFKAGVGQWLYLPEVTAASVEANVIINNRFLTLLENENGETSEVTDVLHSLAEAFSDSLADEADEVSRILRELQATTQHDEVAQERISRFTRLLQIATKTDTELSLPLPPLPEMLVVELEGGLDFPPEPDFMAAPPVNEADEELQVFAAQPENQDLLAAYRKASAEVRKLDLHCFLSPLPDGNSEEMKSESKWRRAALEVIFRADELVQTELGADCEPGTEIEARVDKLFDNLGQLSDEMRDLIKVTHKHEQNANYEVLLHVYNQLMAARLRLQSAIVRRSASELAQAQAEPTTRRHAARQRAADAASQDEPKAARVAAPRRWVMIVCTILMVASVGLHIAIPTNRQEAPDDAAVVQLNRSEMPSGDLFLEAKLHRDLMICIVAENWLSLSAHEQKEKLDVLFAYGQERGAERILLLSGKGVTVGSITKSEVYVN